MVEAMLGGGGGGGSRQKREMEESRCRFDSDRKGREEKSRPGKVMATCIDPTRATSKVGFGVQGRAARQSNKCTRKKKTCRPRGEEEEKQTRVNTHESETFSGWSRWGGAMAGFQPGT